MGTRRHRTGHRNPDPFTIYILYLTKHYTVFVRAFRDYRDALILYTLFYDKTPQKHFDSLQIYIYSLDSKSFSKKYVVNFINII